LRSELTQLAARAGLHLGASLSDKDAQVLFLGLVPDPPSYMLGARALILTSRAEGLPMVILEALSLGLPVLAADGPSGGERAALKGEGRCNPLRADVENAPAGALLPVPRADELASLQPWVDALSIASQDEPQWRAWRDGALERAVHFSSASAREKWLQALDFTSSRS
jgi:glycosyltransferase involved in cell wall biosynthesis